MKNKKQSGFTILEILAVMAVSSVIASIGIPSLTHMLAKRRVEGAATQLQAQLLQLRSQAIKQDGRVFLSFAVNGNNWSYGANDNGVCNPDTVGNCKVDGVEKIFSGDAWRGVSVKLSQNFTQNSVGFEPRRGMAIAANGIVDSGTITLQSSAGEVVVNIGPIGQVNICSPSGIGSFSACAS